MHKTEILNNILPQSSPASGPAALAGLQQAKIGTGFAGLLKHHRVCTCEHRILIMSSKCYNFSPDLRFILKSNAAEQ